MRCGMTLTLLLIGIVVSQPTVTSTRIEAEELTCLGSAGKALSSASQANGVGEACRSGALASPRKEVAIQPDHYRTAEAGRPTIVPVATTDPAADPADVPLGFNDPVYANVATGTSRIALSPDSSLVDASIVEHSGEPTITCDGSCNITRVRIQSREGVRCISGNINLTWVYIAATGVGSDHADGLQCYSPGSTGTVTVKNSTFKMAGATTAGYWSADNWRGSHVFENVLFEGGNHGLRIPADGGSSVSLKNVYFVLGSFRYSAFLFDTVNGRRIRITQWENVRWANWQGDKLVLGQFIPRP
ncbi:hypothetical protein [Bradyrhizobium sp. CCGE-LA001]|uniref:hypothetical protein n=1 Tax=Bradyrhizobium sp. CCGE-LA001 TaxID=1223566 RepID=UPI0002ED0DCD|nr:hypothetical protein [Bradyrhizobium sp. CCGE-LA001]AMA56736.1 hypothetical protein BCCGELA001_11055 [Bradyrhizobium sp. CCGE-LA001]